MIDTRRMHTVRTFLAYTHVHTYTPLAPPCTPHTSTHTHAPFTHTSLVYCTYIHRFRTRTDTHTHRSRASCTSCTYTPKLYTEHRLFVISVPAFYLIK